MSDVELARTMLTQAEANLAYVRSEADASYADIVFCMAQVAKFSDRLFALTFAGISSSSR